MPKDVMTDTVKDRLFEFLNHDVAQHNCITQYVLMIYVCNLNIDNLRVGLHSYQNISTPQLNFMSAYQ